MVHNTKAAAPAVPRCCVGLLRLTTMDPTTSRGPWKSIGTLWERNCWCLQDLCPGLSCWLSPGTVRHGRSDRNDGFARVLLQFAPCSKGLYPFVGQCQVTRDQFSMEQEPHPKPATAPGKGMFELWACLRSLTKRREKKTYTKNQPRAVLSQFFLLETPSFPRVKFSCSF